MRVDILLSHHGTHELDRCLQVGRAHLCARCAGMYPAMGLTLAATLPSGGLGAGGTGELVGGVLGVLGVGLWGVERLRAFRFRGANAVRVLAGAVLGVSLGVMLARHFVEPFAPPVVRQIVLQGGVAVAFVLVDLLSRVAVRTRRDDDDASGRREAPRP